MPRCTASQLQPCMYLLIAAVAHSRNTQKIICQAFVHALASMYFARHHDETDVCSILTKMGLESHRNENASV